MRIRTALAVGLTLALGGGQAAQACSMIPDPNYNRFADYGFTPGADMIGKAQSIDWAVVEAPTSERCAPGDQITPGGRAFWRFVPRVRWINRLLAHLPGEAVTGTCNGKPVHGLIAPLRARVVERLAGSGPKVYPLWQEVRPDAGEWNMFSDDRTLANGGDDKSPTAYPVPALKRHHGNGFLDHGRLSTEVAPGSWCGGGDLIAHVGHRYLIFRDAQGSILSATRVAYADDALLIRLRRYAGRPELFSHPTLPVEDFIRASDGAAIVRITRCEKGFWGKVSDGVVEAGDPTAIWSGSRPIPKAVGMPELEWLGMHLERTRQACRPADHVLILKSPFSYQEPRLGYPRAAVIHDGMVRPRDFLTGFTLTGPSEVSVDQAFAWVAEGKAARGAAH